MSSKRNTIRKIREEEEATAHAFQEFIQTFQSNTMAHSKTFVKSGVLHPTRGQEQSDKGQIYKPKMNIKQDPKTVKTAIECARLLKDNKLEKKEKPKSNLELLKEELKLRHSISDEKSKLKMENESWGEKGVVGEVWDSNTTNLFVTNLNPNVTENDLMQLFGTFGPLASVKIMWPRGEENHRATNCGFVAFMSRKDGERALSQLKDRNDMTIGWAKCVEIPANPVYIPPELLKFHMPPPYTGLPFNAQPNNSDYQKPKTEAEMAQLLYNSTIKVTIPLNKKLLILIHRMVEFVVREGPLFEAMIMNREINNPVFQFLFDNKSPLHIYYRWKLYSIMQGESKTNWSTKHFRMFEGGSVWIPPIVCDYTEGMPSSLVKLGPKIEKTRLSDTQLNRLMNYIQNLTMQRKSISEVMIFCLNHQEALNDVLDLIIDSFRNINTKPIKKIARLYLLTDVLYNVKNRKALKNDQIFQNDNSQLLEVYEQLHATMISLKNNEDKEEFRTRVQKVLKAWELWSLIPFDMVAKLEIKFTSSNKHTDTEEEYFADEPLDGANLLKRSVLNSGNSSKTAKEETDPRKRQIDYSVFVPSKWETVDPEQIESQAMSSKKFFNLEKQRQINETGSRAWSKENREKLRKVEIMVLQYREEIEAGKRKPKKGICLEKEIEDYRTSLMEKMKKDLCKLDYSPISSDSDHSEEERFDSKSKKKRKRKESRKEANKKVLF